MTALDHANDVKALEACMLSVTAWDAQLKPAAWFERWSSLLAALGNDARFTDPELCKAELQRLRDNSSFIGLQLPSGAAEEVSMAAASTGSAVVAVAPVGSAAVAGESAAPRSPLALDVSSFETVSQLRLAWAVGGISA